MKTKKIVASLAAAGALVMPAVALSACNTEETAKPKQTDGISRGLGTSDAKDDVKFGSLELGTFNDVSIPVRVTNHSSETSNYTIEAKLFDQNGTQVGTAMTYVSDVAPGGKAKDTLLGMAPNAETFKPSMIERTASVS